MTYETLINALEYIRPSLLVLFGFSVMLLIHLVRTRHIREDLEHTILQQSDRIRRLISRNDVHTFSTSTVSGISYASTLTEMTSIPCSTWGDVKKPN